MKIQRISILGLTLSCAAWAAPTPPPVSNNLRLLSTLNGAGKRAWDIVETTDAFLLGGPAQDATIRAVRASWAGSANSPPCVLETRIENIPVDFGDWQDQGVFETPRCIQN